MFNLVELCADPDEQTDAPCKWGNVVVGHACYCHNDEWAEGPRKCPIYRNFGMASEAWRLGSFDDDEYTGGCPKFEPCPTPNTGEKP